MMSAEEDDEDLARKATDSREPAHLRRVRTRKEAVAAVVPRLPWLRIPWETGQVTETFGSCHFRLLYDNLPVVQPTG